MSKVLKSTKSVQPLVKRLTDAERRERKSERQRGRRGTGHSRKTDAAEYGAEASRRRVLARIAEQLAIVTAWHAAERKPPRPSCIPDPDATSSKKAG